MAELNEHRILVVDDEEPLLKIVRRLLKRNGFADLVTALDAEQAIQQIERAESPFSLIISDQKMPGMCGNDFLARTIQMSPDSRRILLTGYSNFKSAVDAVNKGAIHYYMSKPFDSEGLIRIVKQELDQYDQALEKKHLVTFTKHQNARYFTIAKTLKGQEKKFCVEIQSKTRQLEDLTNTLEQVQASNQGGVGLDEVLLRNIVISPEALVSARSLMVSLLKDFFMGLSGTTGYPFDGNADHPDLRLECSGPGLNENLYRFIDLVIDQVISAADPRLLEMGAETITGLGAGDRASVPDIGELARDEGYISQAELEQALMGTDGDDRSIEKKMLEMNLITRKEMSFLVTKRELINTQIKDRRFAEILLDRKLVKPNDIQHAFVMQINRFRDRADCVSLADILVENELLSVSDRNDIMTQQEQLQDNLDYSAPVDSDQERQLSSAIDLTVSDDKIYAYMNVSPLQGVKVDCAQVRRLLSKKGISFGIVEEKLLQGYLNYSPDLKKKFTVAIGRHPIHGVDARIDYFFNTNYRKAGIVFEDGTIDFKERGEIPFVSAGTLLASKTPMKRGVPGRDIFGEMIPFVEPLDRVFRCGKGAILSEDGLQIVATEDGQPVLDAMGTVSVVTELRIKGNVDYETGHIDYNGNVSVTGIIQEGFQVRCACLTVDEINGGIIDASGDVNVSKGIINARIVAQGNLRAKFVNNSVLDVFGTVEVSREIMGSEVFSSGEIVNSGGRITNSTLSAKMGFSINQVGTERSAASVLKPGGTDGYERLIQRIDTGILERQAEIGALTLLRTEAEKNNIVMHKDVTDLSFAQEKMEQDLARRKQELLTIREDHGKLADLLAAIKNLEAETSRMKKKIRDIFMTQDSIMEKIHGYETSILAMEQACDDLQEQKEILRSIEEANPPVPVVKVKRSLFAGTRLLGPETSMILKSNLGACTVMEIDATDPDALKRRQMVVQPV